MALPGARSTYRPGLQTNCDPFQAQWPGIHTEVGDGGGGGVSACGGGGAKGATTEVIVPALLGAVTGGVAGPYCGSTGAAVAGGYGNEDAVDGCEFGGR
jgi:hypothetical protein